MTDWIKAARLRTLPLSLSGIIMGLSLQNGDFTEKEESGTGKSLRLLFLGYTFIPDFIKLCQ